MKTVLLRLDGFLRKVGYSLDKNAYPKLQDGDLYPAKIK